MPHFLSGTVSVFGFIYVQPYLEKNIGLLDTAGIHNLHAMPSVIGSLAGIFAVAAISTVNYGSAEVFGVAPSLPSSLIVTSVAEHIPAMGPSTLPAEMANVTFIIQQFNRSAGTQAGFQAAAMFLSFVFAVTSGAFTGWLLRQPFFDAPKPANYFDDLESVPTFLSSALSSFILPHTLFSAGPFALQSISAQVL